MNCGICRVLEEELKVKLKLDSLPDADDRSFNVTASLSIPNPRVDQLYRLDFEVQCDSGRCQRTFVLKETNSSEPHFRTPLSNDTSSDEVYQLAMHWMRRCQCRTPKEPDSYPARLVSLKQLRDKDGVLNIKSLQTTKQLTNLKVSLVETDSFEAGSNVQYVTLSHCWGSKAISEMARLTRGNIESFKEGINLKDLPKTFQDAMMFAAKLPHVGYIWIDSLCIIQGDEVDWLKQSATMQRVYKDAFLNISATASTNSTGGLFYSRKREQLLEHEIILNIAGLPGANKSSLDTNRPLTRTQQSNLVTPQKGWLQEYVSWSLRAFQAIFIGRPCSTTEDGVQKDSQNPLGSVSNITVLNRSDSVIQKGIQRYSSEQTSKEVKHSDLRRCTILDVSFWSNLVDEAAVNKRGWVLQERLMAPRVLHFCRDQVAWECQEFEAAEGQPEGIPNFQLTVDGIIDGSRLKGLKAESDGKRLRSIRLHDDHDPDASLQPAIYALELWRRIVEVYTKTAVTNPTDKLIALSGLAREMSGTIGELAFSEHDKIRYICSTDDGKDLSMTRTRYVAGLWTLHLASQLLWYTEPVFRNEKSEKTEKKWFEHRTTAPEEYRAPSFSWASIDADGGNGIKYGEVTNEDLFVTVEEVSVTPKHGSDEFGVLERAHIVLWGQLREAVFFKKQNGRFGWRLVGRKGLDEEEHTIVFLDCPERDEKDIVGHDAGMYVVPASLGDRTTLTKESKYMICLILKVDKSGRVPIFRRIGLTKLSPYADHKAMKDFAIQKVRPGDVSMPHSGDYHAHDGMHRILMV